MKIGVPKETKNHEYRVALTPEGVRQLVEAGHAVGVESGAGAAVGYADDVYRMAGATLADAAGASCMPASCCSAICTSPPRRSSPAN